MRHRRRLIRSVVALAALAPAVFGSTAAGGQTPEPGITLAVSIGGASAVAPGPRLPAGSPITLAFTATNAGTVPLVDLVVEDSLLGWIDCATPSLDPGQSVVCERDTETVAGRYRSRAVVSASTADGKPVRTAVRVGYRGMPEEHVAALDLEILLDGRPSGWPGPTLAAGEQVDLTYRVLNRGTVRLERIEVVDSQGMAVVCPSRAVDPGQSVECAAVGTAMIGRHRERAAVRAFGPHATRVRTRSSYHYLGEQRILRAEFSGVTLAGSLPASMGRGPLVRASRSIRWGIDVTNTGEDDLWSLYAEDRDKGRMTCGERHLAPGATVRCTIRGRTIAGPMEGEITVAAWASDGRQVTGAFERHAFGYRPGAGLLIETYVDGFDADVHAGPRRPVGEPIELTYAVHNVGETRLRSVRVRDALFGVIDCPQRVLRSGATMVCTHTEIAELGWWETTGTARARSDTGVVSDTDKTFWHVRAVARASLIGLRVTVDGVNTDREKARVFVAGDIVEIVYLATNDGNSPLWSMEIRDPNVPFAAMTCTGSNDLWSGDTLRCRAAMVVRSGEHWDEIEAVAWNSDGTKIVGESSVHYVGKAGPT
ncbi:MAG: hypothetical protein KKE89_06770 [Actinobacteria bacterium]|nr:hypothetical protein [Actinomycetota bacterium]